MLTLDFSVLNEFLSTDPPTHRDGPPGWVRPTGAGLNYVWVKKNGASFLESTARLFGRHTPGADLAETQCAVGRCQARTSLPAWRHSWDNESPVLPSSWPSQLHHAVLPGSKLVTFEQ